MLVFCIKGRSSIQYVGLTWSSSMSLLRPSHGRASIDVHNASWGTSGRCDSYGRAVEQVYSVRPRHLLHVRHRSQHMQLCWSRGLELNMGTNIHVFNVNECVVQMSMVGQSHPTLEQVCLCLVRVSRLMSIIASQIQHRSKGDCRCADSPSTRQ